MREQVFSYTFFAPVRDDGAFESRRASRPGMPRGSSAMPYPADAPIDLEKTLERFENDRELLREVVSVFVEEAPERSQKIARAFAARDMEQLVRLSHSLKGVCGTMHAEPLRELCYQVEMAARAGDAQKVVEGTPVLLAMLSELTDYLSGELRDGLGGM